MNLTKIISVFYLISGATLSRAFAPSKTLKVGPRQTTTTTTRNSATALLRQPELSSLSQASSRIATSKANNPTQLNGVVSDFVSALENIPEGTDLVVGAFIIFCAVTPYFLGLFFPETFDQSLFMKIYGDQDKKDVLLKTIGRR